jgi:plastocyanin
MRRRLALAAAALVAAACGGGGGYPSSPTTNPPPAGGSTSTGSTISIPSSDGYGNSSFAPGNLTVNAGATVTWSNRDTVAHTTASGTLWSATMQPGESFSRTFADRGTFPYRCTIHAGMSGTVTVQ